MNKILSILLVICLVLLGISISMTKDYAQQITDLSDELDMVRGESYDEGYKNGYDVGYEDGFEARSEDTWENSQSILYAMEEALHYARDNSGWHPEEAVDLIEAYQQQLPYYENGNPPTRQDYLAAVQSLQDFFEYFYSGKYK